VIDAATLASLRTLANSTSLHRRRAEAMGFKFTEIDVHERPDGMVYMTAVFTCVCGKPEMLQRVFSPAELDGFAGSLAQIFDPAAEAYRLGSFSRGHLEADGFAPADIERILAAGERFDHEGQTWTFPRLPTLSTTPWAKPAAR